MEDHARNEQNRMEKNAWPVAEEVAERIDGAPILGEFIDAWLTPNGGYLNTEPGFEPGLELGLELGLEPGFEPGLGLAVADPDFFLRWGPEKFSSPSGLKIKEGT